MAESRGTGDQVRREMTRILGATGRRALRARLLGHDSSLSPTEIGILQMVSAEAPVRATTLAAMQGVDKSTLTPPIKRLESHGLIDRRPDPQDARASLLTVSRKGGTLLRRLDVQGASVFEELLASWPTGDRRELVRLLGLLADELDELEAAGRSPERSRSGADARR